MHLDNPSSVRRLPLMRNFDDAELVYRERNDPFYLVAFMIQLWLGDLLGSAAAQYAENKNPRDRSLQSGEAFRALTALSKLKPDKPCSALLASLYRFSVEDNSPRNSLRHALARLSIEHNCTGDYLGPKTMKQFSRETSVECREQETPRLDSRPSTLDQPSGPSTLDSLCRRTPGLKRPRAYPCSAEHEFAPYCRNVLGLKKIGRGRTAKTAIPRGTTWCWNCVRRSRCHQCRPTESRR